MKKSGKFAKLIATALSCSLALSCFATGVPFAFAASAADTSGSDSVSETTNSGAATITNSHNTWSFDNDILSAEVEFSNGTLALGSLYNKAAEREYITPGADNYLFSYTIGDYINGGGSQNDIVAASNDGSWSLESADITDIVMNESDDVSTVLGKQLSIVISSDTAELTVTAVFQIYDDVSGMHYQCYIQNNADVKRVITQSDVISMALPDESHVLHYVEAGESSTNSNSALNSVWKSTTGALAKNTGRNALCVYDSGDGWWVMPETNWRTQIGPTTSGAKPSETTATYEFATTSCFSGDDKVKVTTNPDSMQLTLKPDEEFQYIGVNITVFEGDVVDGKMAAEEHFQKRYQYHDTSTIMNTNDWDYIGKRSYEYFEDTVVPKAKAAGVDMVMLDDLWNTSRDSITAISSLGSLSDISSLITGNGLKFGLWFSMSGGDHNNGRDLADPQALSEKISQIKELIGTYGLSHQMIDLTEFWQNTQETSYSSPCDNVYRKNAMVNTALNEVVAENPNYLVKFTNEIDVYPTQGNRQNGLLQLVNNGWLVHNAGLGGGMASASNSFGYLPLSSTYTGGTVTGDMAMNYHFMFIRNVKLNEDPGVYWTDKGIEVLSEFNSWRKGSRVEELTDLVKHPTYLGAGWDSDDDAAWSSGSISTGPYSWMYINQNKDRALLVSTSYTSAATEFTADTRWFDSAKNYMVADVTLDDSGAFTYAYKGVYSGEDLTTNGFDVDLTENTSGGKAYWFEAVDDTDNMQVVYADENITDYSSTVNGDVMTLTLTGEAGASGTVIVGDSLNNTGRVINVTIGDNGTTVLSIPRSKLYAPSSADTVENSTVRYEMENLIADNAIIYDSSKVTVPNSLPDDGKTVGASGGTYHVINFTQAGAYFSVPITVEGGGSYKVRVAYKSHNNEALSAIGANGTVVSDTLDLSTGVTLNKIYVQECTVQLNDGENTLDVFCMGKGSANATSTLALRIDYIEFEPVVDADPLTISAADLASGITASAGASMTTSADGITLSASAPSACLSVPVTSAAGGRFNVTANFTASASGAVVGAYINGNESLGDSADLYNASGGTASLSLGTMSFTAGETKYVDFVITGRNSSNTTGFTALLNSISMVALPSVAVSPAGSVVQVGDTVDLAAAVTILNTQPAYAADSHLKYQVMSESAFDVVEVNNGILTANSVGSAIVRISHKNVVDCYTDYYVSVVPGGLSSGVQAVMLAINQIGTVTYTDSCKAAIANAESLYAALSSADRALVENDRFLTAALSSYNALAADNGDDTALSAINYVEDLNVVVNDGSTYKKKLSVSSVGTLQFTDGGEVYTHGFGFEPTTATPGTLLVPVPEGSDYFYVKVGLDAAMSAPSMNYDQKNVVTVSVDGTQMYQTGKILKNYQNGQWVDNSYEIEFAVPEGAKWLLIQNDSGGSRECDHIIFADARFENSAAANVQNLIDNIMPENVNIAKYDVDTGAKIRAAEEAYFALSAENRAYVASDYTTLINYRLSHANFGLLDTDLGAGLTDTQRQNIAAVEALIAKIPSESAITSADTAKVDAAKAAYEALSDTEKDCIRSVVPIYMGYEWIANNPITYLLGDVDNNGGVTVSDVVELRDLIMSGTWTDQQFQSGNLDGNDGLTVSDVVELRDYIMQKG